VTEVQYEGNSNKLASSNEGYAEVMARFYTYALANGADKLFYVNLRQPEFLAGAEQGGPGFSNLSAIYTFKGKKTKLFASHKLIAEKLSNFEEVEILKQSVTAENQVTRISLGIYKFKIKGKDVFVLFAGKKSKINPGDLPFEHKERLKITDIFGREKEIETRDLLEEVSESPIFVEKMAE